MMTSRLYLLAGCTYQLNVEDLRRFPGLIFHDALQMQHFYDPRRRVFCLPRNRVFFEVLLFYIQHGILSRPIDLPLDVFSEELDYYFPDPVFVEELKRVHGIPLLSDAVQIRSLPRSALKRGIWRAMEYNETFFGPCYRLVFGSICIASIYLFLSEIIVTRNEFFLEFIEKYRGYLHDQLHPVNVTVRFIDYRPDIAHLSFTVEIVLIFLWIVEFFLRMASAPSLYHSVKTIFFWLDLLNIVNSISYGIVALKYHRGKALLTTEIRSMTLIFQWIDIFKTVRMIQLGKYHPRIALIVRSLSQATMGIFTVAIVLLGSSCVFGSVIYTVERMTNPTSTRLFPSVGVSVYYTILAITNVGFEGFLPSTYLGKWVACAAITIGLFTIALPLPLILSPYTRQSSLKNPRIIYRDEREKDIPDESPKVKDIRRY